MLKMTDIGNITHIAHLVAEMSKVTVDDVKRYCRTRMAEMTVAVDSRAADIHADYAIVYRAECFLVAGESVVYRQIVWFHD